MPASLPALVAAIEHLRDHPQHRLDLGRHARRAVERAMDWNVRAEDYRRFFRTSLAAARDTTAGTPPECNASDCDSARDLLTRATELLRANQVGGARTLLERAHRRFPEQPEIAAARRALLSLAR